VFPPVIVAPAGADQLLANLRNEKGQLLSVPAYGEARSYLSRANVGEEAADRLVSETLAVWDWAKADERQAVAARVAAQVVVNAYKEALTQLAMAEYTGQAMVSKSNIVSLEVQVYKGELAMFAATDTTAELLRAEAHLAACKRQVIAARALVAMDWGLVHQANGIWEAAVIQVSTSTKALAMATRRSARTAGSRRDGFRGEMGAPPSFTTAACSHACSDNYSAHLDNYSADGDYYDVRRGLPHGRQRAHGSSRWSLVEGDGADDFWGLAA
jgi:hypothetical protein